MGNLSPRRTHQADVTPVGSDAFHTRQWWGVKCIQCGPLWLDLFAFEFRAQDAALQHEQSAGQRPWTTILGALMGALLL